MAKIDDQLAGVLEIRGDAPADDGLHLAQPPIGATGTAHEGAGGKRNPSSHSLTRKWSR